MPQKNEENKGNKKADIVLYIVVIALTGLLVWGVTAIF